MKSRIFPLTMAVLSTLRPSPERLASLIAAYSRHRPAIQRGLTASFVLYVFGTTITSFTSKPSAGQPRPNTGRNTGGGGKGKGKADGDGKAPRVAVDAVFYERLSRILRIVIPRLRSKEAMLLVMHSSLLIFRTAISLYVAALDGKCVNPDICMLFKLTDLVAPQDRSLSSARAGCSVYA